MRRYARWILVGSLFAAACSDSSTLTQPTPADQVTASDLSDVHVMPLIGQPTANRPDSSGAFFAPATGNGINYHGGPVLATVKVAVIYWGTSTLYPGGPAVGTTGTGAQDGSLIGTFLRSLGGSSYWLINTDYSDSGNHFVPGAASYTGFWADNENPGRRVTDKSIRSEITQAFSLGKLAYDANTVYSVLSGPGVNLGGGFGTQYCAYHGKFTWNSKVVLYSVQPYNSGVSGCQMQSTGPNASPADAEVNTFAHEIEEAATDPQLNAWYDSQGEENADKCAWTFGTQFTAPNGAKYNMTFGGKNWLIQQNWRNRNGGSCGVSLS